MHLVGFLLTLNHDARNHKLKNKLGKGDDKDDDDDNDNNISNKGDNKDDDDDNDNNSNGNKDMRVKQNIPYYTSLS